MKADSTINRELRALRHYIDSPDADPLTARIAWEVEQAIRWARQDVKAWPRPLDSAAGCANLIRQEMKTGAIK